MVEQRITLSEYFHQAEIQDTEKKCSTEELLNSIQIFRVWEKSSFLNAFHSCEICLRKYSIGDYVRLLPCKHKFHYYCIDNWIKWVGTYCPIDRVQLLPQNEANDEVMPEENSDSEITVKGSSMKQNSIYLKNSSLDPLDEPPRRTTIGEKFREMATPSFKSSLIRKADCWKSNGSTNNAVTGIALNSQPHENSKADDLSLFVHSNFNFQGDRVLSFEPKFRYLKTSQQKSPMERTGQARVQEQNFNEELEVKTTRTSTKIYTSLEDHFNKLSKCKRKIGKQTAEEQKFQKGDPTRKVVGASCLLPHYANNNNTRSDQVFQGLMACKPSNPLWILKGCNSGYYSMRRS